MERPNVFVITDPGLDPDDVVNAWLLAKMHQLGEINLIGMIANMSPSDARAKLLKSVLEELGVPGIPVIQGSSCNTEHKPKPYEFDFPPPTSKIEHYPAKLIAQQADHSVTLLLISGLTDIAYLQTTWSDLLQAKLKEVYIMGGGWFEDDKFVADPTASNNKFDPNLDPQNVYDWFIDRDISLNVLTRFAAYGAGITPKFYEIIKTENAVGSYLFNVQEQAIQSLWEFANGNPPEHRQNRSWFLNTFCGVENLDVAADDSIWPHVKKLALYDPLTSLWMRYSYWFKPTRIGKVAIAGLKDDPGLVMSAQFYGDAIKRYLTCDVY